MAKRSDHIASLILKNISEIVQFDLHHPTVGFVTVTAVQLSDDLSFAKVYFSFLGKGEVEPRMKALEKSKGFIRSELAKRLAIYKVPELQFNHDDSFDKGQRIQEILKKVNK